MNGQHVRLRDFRVSQGSARVISGVDQLYFGQIQRPVAEHSHVFVAQRGQVGRVPFPNDRRRRIAADVTSDLHVVADLRRYPVYFECFLQRDHRQAWQNNVQFNGDTNELNINRGFSQKAPTSLGHWRRAAVWTSDLLYTCDLSYTYDTRESAAAFLNEFMIRLHDNSWV